MSRNLMVELQEEIKELKIDYVDICKLLTEKTEEVNKLKAYIEESDKVILKLNRQLEAITEIF